jgi:hypothetical protein
MPTMEKASLHTPTNGLVEIAIICIRSRQNSIVLALEGIAGIPRRAISSAKP